MGQKKINALWGYQEGLTALGAANRMSLKLAAMNKKWNISKDNQNSFFFQDFFLHWLSHFTRQ